MKNLMLAVLLAALPMAAMAQAAAPTLEQRLQRVEDELAIRRVMIEYAATQDAHDYPAYAALFAKDGVWSTGKQVHKGREAILKMLVDLYGPTAPGYVNNASFHISVNQQIEVQGDHATGRSRHVLFMRDPDGHPRPVLSGRYEDEFIREDGKWKILRRVDYPVMPTPDEWMKFIQEQKPAK